MDHQVRRGGFAADGGVAAAVLPVVQLKRECKGRDRVYVGGRVRRLFKLGVKVGVNC